MTQRFFVQNVNFQKLRLYAQQIRDDLVSVLAARFQKINSQSQNSMLVVLVKGVTVVIVRIENWTLPEQGLLDIRPVQKWNFRPAPGHTKNGLSKEV